MNKACFQPGSSSFSCIRLSSLVFATRLWVSRKKSYFYENSAFRKIKAQKRNLTVALTVAFTDIKYHSKSSNMKVKTNLSSYAKFRVEGEVHNGQWDLWHHFTGLSFRWMELMSHLYHAMKPWLYCKALLLICTLWLVALTVIRIPLSGQMRFLKLLSQKVPMDS